MPGDQQNLFQLPDGSTTFDDPRTEEIECAFVQSPEAVAELAAEMGIDSADAEAELNKHSWDVSAACFAVAKVQAAAALAEMKAKHCEELAAIAAQSAGRAHPRASYDALEAELRAHAELHLSRTAILHTPLSEFGATVEDQCATVEECTSLLAQLRAQMTGLAQDGELAEAQTFAEKCNIVQARFDVLLAAAEAKTDAAVKAKARTVPPHVAKRKERARKAKRALNLSSSAASASATSATSASSGMSSYSSATSSAAESESCSEVEEVRFGAEQPPEEYADIVHVEVNEEDEELEDEEVNGEDY